ncbi:nucleoporin subcomplex protein binding to Pom34-domain-containing protein [Dissophora ornata]|nr:hypothetical protein BGZ58_007587 [Dissophora ornata]KAI8604604.1 nucleoporin subcomplex protein binding to Pom34-domain-containing protein [Dissophora ornata]
MSQYSEPSSTVSTRSFEGAFLAVATQYERTGALTDALKVVVEDRINEIKLGLEAFKKPSATSRTGMTTATRADGKKFTDAQVILAKRLSDIVKLDEMQALKIIDDFSLELNVPDTITEDVVLKAVISYWKERSSLVSLLGELVRQSAQNGSNLEYEKIAVVEGIKSQSVALIRKLLAQYNEKVLEDAPEYFTANAGYLDLWIGQSLTEQSALLESMIALAYGGTDSKTELPGAVISTLISTQFGKQQAYRTRFKVEAVDNWEGIRLLCVTLSLASLDLESLFNTSTAESYESSDHVFKSTAQVQNINKALQSAERQQELGPFILAWSNVLWASMASQSGDQTESRRFAAQLVYVSIETLDVFKYLHGIFANELFQPHSKDGSTYKRMFFLLLEVSLLNHDSKAIKDFDGLVACLADLLTDEPDLCQNIWQESPALGQGTVQVLDTARGRFPLQFEPLAKLLSALATGGKESAEHTVYYFSHLPSLTHLIQITQASIEVNAHPTTGATVLKALQDVPFGIIPERPLLVLPAGTTGSLISGPNAAHIVQWRHENSGWDLCLTMLEAFQQVNVEDFEPKSRVDISQIKAILDLSEAVYRYPAVAHGLLDTLAGGEGKGSPIPTFFAILDQCSKFQQPPLDVIASCLKCITRLADSYTQDVWLYLRQSSFLPSVITTTVQFTGLSRVQTSGLAYNILSRFECLRGHYAVTLAFLDLVQKLITDAQQMEIWDQQEMRCTKSEVLYPCLVYFQNDIFINYESWQYTNIRDRFSIASKILSIFNSTLDDLPLLSGSDPSDYIGLDTLQEYLFKNFLFDGGKQLTLPLVSIIGSGPDFSAYFSKYNRLREMEEIWIMVLEGLKLVKTLLRHRKMSGGQPSFLEVYMIDRTVGRANASLIRVLASYCDFSCGEAAALESTDVLTLLCSLTSEWKTRPSFVGYLGTTEQAQQLVSTLVSRVIDDSQPTRYRIALWSFITITLTTQPGLAILFLSKDHMNPDTKVPDNHFKESAKNSVLFKALEILHKGDVVLKSDPETLPHALHFLDVLWQNAKDHAVVIKGLQENEVFWQDLAQILSRPEAHTDLECGHWEDAATQYNRDALAQVWNVTHANADQRSRGDALRIFALAIHYHCAEKGVSSRNLDSLPKGVKGFVEECASKGRFLEWNDTFPVIHYHIEGHRELKRMRRFMSSSFDYQKLAVRRWDDFYDTDYLPGDSFMLDLERARCKLIWSGREHEHAFLRTVFHVNLNTSMVHSEMHLLSAWRFFMDVVATNLECSVWATKAGKTASPEWYYEFVNSLLGHIERDTMGSLILGMARQHCSHLLLSVIESTTSIKRSDKKNMAVYFPEIVTRLQRLIQSPDVDLLTAIQSPVEGQSAHQPLLLAILFCYRALHEKDVLSSLDLERLEELQKSAILIQPTIANCFSTIVESHLLGQHDHSDNIVILLALLEELCHPVWNPHPSLWIPILRNSDVFRFNLQLCARSVSSGDYDNRPSFFEGSLNFLLALANIPEMAVYLCDAGVMSMLTHNGLTPLIQRGEISHLNGIHGDRGNWHQAWCMMLATVTSLLRTMCTNEAFLQLLIGFITLYSNQIKVGLETSTDGPLTSAKLEELERITMLFYELSKNDARLETLGGGWLLPAFFEHSRYNLQHAVYFFTHPHTLASAILPITVEENKAKETGQGSALSTLIEGKLAAVVRNILSTILAWTDPAVILTKSNLEWPIRKRVIEPTTETQASKPASFGTMFDLVQYASTSLKEWEARLEGKTGGSAGLYKDAGDDDRQNNVNTTSSKSTTSSTTSSRLAHFGNLLTATAPSPAASTNAAAGSLLTTKPSSSTAPSQPASSSTSSASASLAATSTKANESAFATLSTTTGSSTRMISLLEDALVVIATQLGLYMYYPEQDATSRRDIQDQCMDLISTLNSTQRMLQRFENVPVQARRDSLGEEAHAMIRSLRDIMIPIIKNFAETKIIVL